MKRILTAVFLCAVLLVFGFLFLFPVSGAKENVLESLLKLPAPPPPNPYAAAGRERPANFFDKKNPPGDDAPIEDLLDYWKTQSEHYARLGYNVYPSEKSLSRILAEVRNDPSKVGNFLGIFPENRETADLVKGIYDNPPDILDRDQKREIKKWLTYHSPYFSSDLARTAEKAGDAREYVSNQEELLALAGADWDLARPMVDRLYVNSHSASGVLAKWALYVHALRSGDVGEIDRYRDELKTVVEDRTAAAGMRDLAFDALVKETDWPGRDEWYYSLLGDETLADLRVNGASYTGLTTIVMYSSPDKYADKMIELTRSSNVTVRSAAARNLLIILDADHPEVARALVPWLDDPKWANDVENSRLKLVSSFRYFKIPESVPGLIAALDEKQIVQMPDYSKDAVPRVTTTNTAVTNVMKIAPAANTGFASNAKPVQTRPVIEYPFRSAAISSLEVQRDHRAVPALRRLLPQMEGYELGLLIRTLLYSGGFSTSEEIEALELCLTSAKNFASLVFGPDVQTPANVQINPDFREIIGNRAAYPPGMPMSPAVIKEMLGLQLAESFTAPDNEIITAMINRIAILDQKDPALASLMRKVLVRWPGRAIDSLLLHDLKTGKIETDGVVRLLSRRKELRENQRGEVEDIRTGTQTAGGIVACILEDTGTYEAILAGESPEAKTALFACARLIRAPLDIHKAAANLQSKDKLLASAAESYLESEDSPLARSIVLSLHPDEAKIMGATTAFVPKSFVGDVSLAIQIFASVGSEALNSPSTANSLFEQNEYAEKEKRLQKEVLRDPNLMGIYSLDDDLIRIYKDKILYAWEEDSSRYKERPLSRGEFESLTGLLAREHVDAMPPFLSCNDEVCSSHELLMVGRNGGRRVYVKTNHSPEWLTELSKMFLEMRESPLAQKYHLSRELPGLEVLFADNKWEAVTVWKSGNDLRMLAGTTHRLDKINEEIEDLAENADGDEPTPDTSAKLENLRAKKEIDSIAWYSLESGQLGAAAAQPQQVEYIPFRDNIGVQAASGQWKARVNGIEVRGDSSGLYKVAGGKLTKLQTGQYSDIVATPNGRWVVATRFSPEGDVALVRVNLATNKQTEFDRTAYDFATPLAYVPSINRVLVTFGGHGDEEEGGEPDEELNSDRGESISPDSDSLFLADPETGTLQAVKGEFRPLGQQTFRPLQPAAAPFEFWAALPNFEKRETDVGIYNARTFSFKPSIKIPQMLFTSMKMWVDEQERKVYFVYRGQVLSLPLGK